jgi:hypothetical protein
LVTARKAPDFLHREVEVARVSLRSVERRTIIFVTIAKHKNSGLSPETFQRVAHQSCLYPASLGVVHNEIAITPERLSFSVRAVQANCLDNVLRVNRRRKRDPAPGDATTCNIWKQ